MNTEYTIVPEAGITAKEWTGDNETEIQKWSDGLIIRHTDYEKNEQVITDFLQLEEDGVFTLIAKNKMIVKIPTCNAFVYRYFIFNKNDFKMLFKTV